MATPEKTVVSAVVPPSVKAELERRAVEGDRSLSAEIRQTLIRHLARADEKRSDRQ